MLTVSSDIPSSLRPRAWTLIVAILSGLLPAPADAQSATASPKWTFEMYGGGYASGSAAGGGSIATLPAGAPFTTASGPPTRAVSSWYFGDGAVLLNQVLTQFASGTGASFPRLVPLENALRTNQASRNGGFAFGARLGRALTSKLAIEINVERSLTSLDLDDAARAGLKAVSDSFNEAFRGLLSTSPVANLTVSSTLDAPVVTNPQTRILGALRWTAVQGKRFEAHLIGGGGLVTNGGRAPEATLNGRYSFRYLATSPMDETDTVTIRINQPKNGAVFLVGAGAMYNFSERSGLRVDFRFQSSSNKVETVLSATPRITTLTPTGVLTTAAVISPGIQFSTQTGVRSSLSGPSTNQIVFTGSGQSRQMSVTVGLFRRF